jgi:octaprenyl-diphosphate synthase
VIEAKTAALFTAACEVAPILQGIDATPFATYGHGLGMAFQIVDDVMDYTSPKMGKNKGDDFLEGKLTLPVILAMEEATDTDRTFLSEAITHPTQDNLDDFIACLEKYQAFNRSTHMAQNYADQAVESLAAYGGKLVDLLKSLAKSIVYRKN